MGDRDENLGGRRSKGSGRAVAGLGDLDAAALTLKAACAVVFDKKISNTKLRKVIFAAVPTKVLEAAMAQIDTLARPRRAFMTGLETT